MKRLRRIAWFVLVLVSALLCVATCVVWAFWTTPYSHVYWQPKHEDPDHHYSIAAYEHTGGCQLVMAWNMSTSLGIAHEIWNGANLKAWHSSQAPGRHYYAVELEYRLPAGLFAVLPLLWILLLLWKRFRRGHPPGCCASCGYDLRASPGRCPECGTVPPGKAASGC